jgi:hypothetical protein
MVTRRLYSFFDDAPEDVVLFGHYGEEELERMEVWCRRTCIGADRNGTVFRFQNGCDAFHFRKRFRID